jgi:integrase
MPPVSKKQVNITQNFVDRLQSENKEKYYYDKQLAGFQLKQSKVGKKTFVVSARLHGGGRIKKVKIGNADSLKVSEARIKAQETLNKIRNGIDPSAEKRALQHTNKTLKQLIDEYIEAKNLKTRTIEDYRRYANKKLSHWLNTPIKDITGHEIKDWYVRSHQAIRTTEQSFTFLNALMNYAMSFEIIDKNPCALVINADIRRKPKARQNYLEPNFDLPEFLMALHDYRWEKTVKDSQYAATDLIILILHTGLRFHEARSITWKQVDFERKMLTIEDTKNSNPHRVPLTGLTFDLFEARKKHCDNSPYVFRIKGGKTKSPYVTDIRKTLNAICDDAKVSRVAAHDLRRTFASLLNTIGVGYADEKALMNHSTKDVTTRFYIKPDIEKMRDILFKLENYISEKIPYGRGRSDVTEYYAQDVFRSWYGKMDAFPQILDEQTEYHERGCVSGEGSQRRWADHLKRRNVRQRNN